MFGPLTAQIAVADTRIAAFVKEEPIAALLTTAPGVGPVTACAFAEKAEQHLEDRSDNRSTRDNKPTNNRWGLDAGRRFTKGISIGVGQVYGVIADPASTGGWASGGRVPRWRASGAVWSGVAVGSRAAPRLRVDGGLRASA